ncbi:SulP family inorganic anion transporter [Paraflavitalea sp. CAU 1676]|uniref:SulP family inorganic anion transporter n=1 Tax=Paraflavitalea sp. CAU 1676 TaxID=3032598 RepID=UPI0023DAA2CC|nr:SulP family inorganic anion transporter [Paraflavitalea sp. CAU 1676]MDF2191296.1 SulP family inorganic anion transporter [Paraflavitalea sp. CAU 1676]
MFRPKLVDTLKDYSTAQFGKDLLAGIIVGIVALPLAIAFSIASGVSPEKGLYTAVIAGFIISALGGSRVQIGGPTGAFIVIVYGIVQQNGINGLIIATFMAGIILVMMGAVGLGKAIQYIPYPLIVGFTSGIALLIFSSQIKDFFGLQMGPVPADFIEKWKGYASHLATVNWYAFLIAGGNVFIIVFWPRITHKVPGSLIALLISTAVVSLLHLPVETIGARFGDIPSSLPAPAIPALDFTTIKNMVQPAFTIALLGGIESLLSAVVADGMTGGRHRSNMELVAQGIANIGSSVFGGIPATGAIARTATNIKNGARTPVAGIVHATTLLLIMLFAGKWAALIPMPALAGILVVVAYNMSEWHSFRAVLKGPHSDISVLLTTFLLTVLIDLTVAIEIGIVLAAFLFMRKMIQTSGVNILTSRQNERGSDNGTFSRHDIPKGVEVFEITGPLFFGATYKFKDAMRVIEKPPKVLIIRMGQVPIIDATGIKAIQEVYTASKLQHTKLILSEVDSIQVLKALRDARLLFAIGKGNVTTSFEAALARSKTILHQQCTSEALNS